MLTCRHCGYDLRGLPGNICPECGNTFDPDAPFIRHEGGNGAAGSIMAVSAAVLVIVRCTMLALDCISENHVYHCCRSVSSPGEDLAMTGVAGVLVATAGWGVARTSPICGRLARCAAISALAAWITCAVLSG